MKSCPTCKNQYSDDTLQFCLQDGTPLDWTGSQEAQTVVLGETETVVSRDEADRVNIPIGDPAASGGHSSQVTNVASAIPAKKGSNTVLAVALTAIGMLVLFAIIGIGALVFMRNRQRASVSNTNITPNTKVLIPNTNHNSNTMASATSTPLRSPPATPGASPAPSTDPPPALKSYPSTTRLKFGRGSYSTTFSGDINPGDSRSLVLACRSGQSLSAYVSSGGGCARFRAGGASITTSTVAGDNQINVTNNCSTVVHFSVRVSVF